MFLDTVDFIYHEGPCKKMEKVKHHLLEVMIPSFFSFIRVSGARIDRVTVATAERQRETIWVRMQGVDVHHSRRKGGSNWD